MLSYTHKNITWNVMAISANIDLETLLITIAMLISIVLRQGYAKSFCENKLAR